MRYLLAVACALMAVLPASALAAGNIPGVHEAPLGDSDARTGAVEPTAAQRNAVPSGASVTWNRFGTPHTMIKHGGYLATGVSGATAVEAARNWLAANKALFRLSSLDGLSLLNDSRLVDSDGHAVHFRQEFGGVRTSEDGLVTVGVVGSAGNWKVAHVASALTGDTALAAKPSISAQTAWVTAAANVGRAVSLVSVGTAKKDRDWTVFGVQGYAQPQRARLVALPTPTQGVRPAWETLIVDVDGQGHSEGYTHYVDAASGAVLLRKNLVHQSHAAADVFTGAVAGPDGTCDTKGPWVVDPDESVKSIAVAAEATLTTNDIVLQLKRDGAVVASQDTLYSPEALHYAPAGGVPAGSYTVSVCDYVDGHPWDAPNTYTGQIAFNEAATPGVPYPPKWKVFPANPLLPGQTGYPWNIPSTDIREVWCWDSAVNGTPVAGCDDEVKNSASRAPWDHNARTNTPTFTTGGNNAHAAEAWANPPTVQFGNLTPGPTGYRPVSQSREYVYPWTNKWYESKCDPTALTPGGNDIDAATTNLFVMHNRMHDWSYHLGLTEENWNAQDVNYGNGGMELDPVIGDVQSGAVTGGAPTYGGRDNANMLTLPDGVPPITNMYLWQPLRGAFYAPCVDGDYDMAVIGHEYGHMIENRMIGKGGTRAGHHAGAMGESNGDLNGMEVLNEYGFVPVAGENPYAVGAYATGNKERGIRNFAMNESPLNFSDMGYDITGPQVHADGEIWSATNFDIREALVAKYNAQFPASDTALQRSCAEGERPADQCPGNRRWAQLMYDAYLLMPVAPTMLQARDAYLAADQMRFGGANQAELWLAFARRGFGEGAFSTNTSADTDTDPKPDFASPLHGEATVTFRAVASDEGNAVVDKARIYVGRYEARVSPVADTNPATSAPEPGANNLDDMATFVPGTYDLLVHAPGYGHIRLTRTFGAGQTVTVTVGMRTNWASKAKGSIAFGDGVRLDSLVDDTERTNWEAAGADARGRSVTVDLAGGVRTIRRVQVSAMLAPGQNRFTALRQFQIWTCNAAVVNCNGPEDYTLRLTSPADAFPGDAPRPVSPALLLRSFALASAVSATHVRFVVLDNQCTGQLQFHSVQDNDPLNTTDCRTGAEGPETPSLLLPRDKTVVAAELQAFSR